MNDLYSQRVRRLFAEPSHAGQIGVADSPTAYVEEGGGNARILLTALLENARLRALRFQVLGCPHLIAAAELVCERFEGRPVESLVEFDAHALLADLSAPVEKTGRLLLLEDAVRMLHERCVQHRDGR